MSEHLKTIEHIKELLIKEDYPGLIDYIEKREKEVRETEDKADSYIDKLVKELK